MDGGSQEVFGDAIHSSSTPVFCTDLSKLFGNVGWYRYWKMGVFLWLHGFGEGQ